MNNFYIPSFGDEYIDLTFLGSQFIEVPEHELFSVNEYRVERRRMRTLDESAQIAADDVTVELSNDLMATVQTVEIHTPTPTPPQTLASRKQLTATAAGVDPNEPAKPLSAYSLFFRDTVSTIKQQNPNSSYNELVAIVANLWELLDDERKSKYINSTEAARLEYIKQMNAYRQQQQQQQQQLPRTSLDQQQTLSDSNMMNTGVTVIQKPTTSQLQTKPAVFTIRGTGAEGVSTATEEFQFANTTTDRILETPQSQSFSNDSTDNALSGTTYQLADNYVQQMQQPQHVPQTNLSDGQTAPAQTTVTSSVTTTDTRGQMQMPTQQPQMAQQEATETQLCIREGCNKRAIVNLNWDDEYCSNECVVAHCRNVFTTWVEEYRLEKQQQMQQMNTHDQQMQQQQPAPQEQQQPVQQKVEAL